MQRKGVRLTRSWPGEKAANEDTGTLRCALTGLRGEATPRSGGRPALSKSTRSVCGGPVFILSAIYYQPRDTQLSVRCPTRVPLACESDALGRICSISVSLGKGGLTGQSSRWLGSVWTRVAADSSVPGQAAQLSSLARARRVAPVCASRVNGGTCHPTEVPRGRGARDGGRTRGRFRFIVPRFAERPLILDATSTGGWPPEEARGLPQPRAARRPIPHKPARPGEAWRLADGAASILTVDLPFTAPQKRGSPRTAHPQSHRQVLPRIPSDPQAPGGSLRPVFHSFAHESRTEKRQTLPHTQNL